MIDRFRIDGRVAVVTGALGNLGPVWADALLDAGATVIGLDLPGATPNAAFTALQSAHPGRLTLDVGTRPPPERGLAQESVIGRYAHRSAPLSEAQPGLRPVQELAWEHDGLHLRLTGQGPWALAELVALADSTR